MSEKSETPQIKTFAGGCHCGAVRFEIDTALEEVVECNCSICSKKGFLHVIEPRERFRLLQGDDRSETYTFGTHQAKHHFCRTCGVASYYEPRSHPEGISANARCLDGVDVKSLKVRPFDGQNWEKNVAALRHS